jgi:hypothetical protein
MQTGRAIIAGAVILAATGAASAWALQPRYSLANPGQGVTVRLDRQTGDMMGCQRLACSAIVKGNKAVVQSDPWAAFPEAGADNQSKP